ncbi:hypothetical protein F2Q69_00009396 [Brassica cretica]|uniref:Uncharacterized protein n=1 Tax=Brassica cretica TaxID=69181 RepID=A0A8S9PA85_BRACR|nr:hypothetical protein F2Q69_00009396 [Brassica cretica]
MTVQLKKYATSGAFRQGVPRRSSVLSSIHCNCHCSTCVAQSIRAMRGRGARALDNPRNATGEHSLE